VALALALPQVSVDLEMEREAKRRSTLLSAEAEKKAVEVKAAQIEAAQKEAAQREAAQKEAAQKEAAEASRLAEAFRLQLIERDAAAAAKATTKVAVLAKAVKLSHSEQLTANRISQENMFVVPKASQLGDIPACLSLTDKEEHELGFVKILSKSCPPTYRNDLIVFACGNVVMCRGDPVSMLKRFSEMLAKSADCKDMPMVVFRKYNEKQLKDFAELSDEGRLEAIKVTMARWNRSAAAASAANLVVGQVAAALDDGSLWPSGNMNA
jgi:hypothetical protein